MPRDYYEVLGVAARRRRRRDQEGVPPARARAAPRRQRPRPRGRGEVQGGRRGLRGALRRRAPPRCTTPTATRACARGGYAPELRGLRLDLRPVLGVLRRGGFDAPSAAARTRGGAVQGGDVAVAVAIDLAEAAARQRGRGRLRRRRAAARPATATAPSPARRSSTCSRCGGAGQLQAVSRTPLRPARRAPRSATSAAATAGSPSSRARRATGAACEVRHAARWSVDVPAGIADGQRIRLSGRGHAGERGGAGRRPLRLVRGRARTSASCATATTS